MALWYNRNGGIKVPGSSLVGLAFFFSLLVIFLLFLFNIYIFFITVIMKTTV